MNRRLSFILACGLTAALCVLGSAQAAILYVDKDNSCPGAGTDANPYCSIQNAFNVVNPGDTIRIRDSASPYDQSANLTRSGTAGTPIIIEPDVGHNPTIRFTGNGAINAAIHLNGVHDVTVQNLTFDGAGVYTSTLALWISGDAAVAVRLQVLGNTFRNWGGSAAQASGVSARSTVIVSGGYCDPCPRGPAGVVIRGNTFDSNRQRALQILHSDNTLIENNVFVGTKCGHDSDGAVNTVGIHILEAAPGQSTGTIIRNNLFHDWEPRSACGIAQTPGAYDTLAAIWCDEGTINGLVEGNVIYNIDQGNANVATSESVGIFIEQRCSGWTVTNNVIHNIGAAGIRQRTYAFGSDPATWTDAANQYLHNAVWSVGTNGLEIATGKTIIKDNIVSNSGVKQIAFNTANAGVHTIDYNLYWDNTGGTKVGGWGGGTMNFANWKSACGCDAHSLNVDPLFVNPPSDFHLQSSSPARGAGEGGVDMGAYIAPTPPTNLRVIQILP
jgi:hypothetical protein